MSIEPKTTIWRRIAERYCDLCAAVMPGLLVAHTALALVVLTRGGC